MLGVGDTKVKGGPLHLKNYSLLEETGEEVFILQHNHCLALDGQSAQNELEGSCQLDE